MSQWSGHSDVAQWMSIVLGIVVDKKVEVEDVKKVKELGIGWIRKKGRKEPFTTRAGVQELLQLGKEV